MKRNDDTIAFDKPEQRSDLFWSTWNCNSS